jgi:hypothetical protein
MERQPQILMNPTRLVALATITFKLLHQQDVLDQHATVTHGTNWFAVRQKHCAHHLGTVMALVQMVWPDMVTTLARLMPIATAQDRCAIGGTTLPFAALQQNPSVPPSPAQQQ